MVDVNGHVVFGCLKICRGKAIFVTNFQVLSSLFGKLASNKAMAAGQNCHAQGKSTQSGFRDRDRESCISNKAMSAGQICHVSLK
jgi:hypothetical protein